MVPRLLVSTFFVLFMLSGVTTAKATDDQEARAFIQDLAQNAITTVGAKDLSDGDRKERFRRLFVSAFDLPEIGKFVLSRYWQGATAAQQAEFLKTFEDLQVLAWSQKFKSYNGEKLETVGAKMMGEGVWLVDSQIIRPQGPPNPVQWRVQRAADGGMHVIDIATKGISMGLTYRQDYTAILQSNGQNFDALLSSMHARVEQAGNTP